MPEIRDVILAETANTAANDELEIATGGEPWGEIRNDAARTGTRNWDRALSATQNRVLEAMRDNPNVTYTQLAGLLGLGYTTIQSAIGHLRKSGHVERVGSRKGGWWNVLK